MNHQGLGQSVLAYPSGSKSEGISACSNFVSPGCTVIILRLPQRYCMGQVSDAGSVTIEPT